jgi:hypothetical protein
MKQSQSASFVDHTVSVSMKQAYIIFNKSNHLKFDQIFTKNRQHKNTKSISLDTSKNICSYDIYKISYGLIDFFKSLVKFYLA